MSTAYEDALRDAVDYTLLPKVRHLEAANARLERDLAARDAQAARDFREVERLTAENVALRQELGRRERAGRYDDGG